MNSWADRTKVISATAITPGRLRGKTMRTKVRSREHPSTDAASSSSIGIVST